MLSQEIIQEEKIKQSVNKEEMDIVIFPKGTIVHFRGMPFELKENTATNGMQANYEMVMSQDFMGISG